MPMSYPSSINQASHPWNHSPCPCDTWWPCKSFNRSGLVQKESANPSNEKTQCVIKTTGVFLLYQAASVSCVNALCKQLAVISQWAILTNFRLPRARGPPPALPQVWRMELKKNGFQVRNLLFLLVLFEKWTMRTTLGGYMQSIVYIYHLLLHKRFFSLKLDMIGILSSTRTDRCSSQHVGHTNTSLLDVGAEVSWPNLRPLDILLIDSVELCPSC